MKVRADGETIDCRIRGKMRLNKAEVTNPIAVGDYVLFDENQDKTGSISEVEERKNYIPRKATHGRRGEQILVANIDMAWVVQSIAQPDLNTGFIDRFLVACEAYQIPVGVLINKVDLVSDENTSRLAAVKEMYQSIDYEVITTSIEDSDSLENLKSKLQEKTSVFIGPSGVGKSSLINAIEPDIELAVGSVSDHSGKGKHTTTAASILPLSFGGQIVDTPGIREFGLVNIKPAELSLFYPEMEEPRENCKFYNCTHFHEPSCGVVEAYEQGDIHPERYNSYLNMLESIRE